MGGFTGLIINDLPKYLFLLLYFALNGFIFYDKYIYYDQDIQFFYTRKLLGSALALARAPAGCLNLNLLLVLLPVCRNLLSYFRQACNCCPRRVRRILDKNIKFHRICAYMIVLNTLIHYFAHCFNVEFYGSAHLVKGDDLETKLKRILSDLMDTKETTYLNPIPIGKLDNFSVGMVFYLTGGWTGVIITTCLFLMVTSSVEFIRRSYFEVFWFTHHLFIVFYGFLVVHGFSKQVRGQTAESLKVHDPNVCSKIPEQWGKVPECPIPQFSGSPPGTWKWVVVPLTLYIAERIIRIIRYHQNVNILKVVQHPSRVVEIQMRKKGFHAEVGQYVFLKCEQISKLEWHPFTLTSAPEENYFSCHIRIAGDWTTALSKLVTDANASEKPVLGVDGPFGTASEDVFSYDVAICVGSGIGVTPFASLLKSVWYKNLNEELTPKLKKVYFFWICPEINAFEWFADMLAHLESQLADIGRRDLIEYHIYLTRGWSTKQAKAIFVHDDAGQDVITGLDQKTFYGRPNWDDVFKTTATKHPGKDIGVFFCGVAALSQILHKMSNKHSSLSGARFHYNKENF